MIQNLISVVVLECCICYSSSVAVGKTDITWMMLDAGAETDVVNSVGRTAAQMAAFVGTSLSLILPSVVKTLIFQPATFPQ